MSTANNGKEVSLLLVMEPSADQELVTRLCGEVERMGLRAHQLRGTQSMAIEISGDEARLDESAIRARPGVRDIVYVSSPYRLVSRSLHPDDTVIEIDNVRIGGSEIVTMAGPCAVESRDQCLRTAEQIAASGAKVFRGGAFKPRTSPYSFDGLKEAGLRILTEVRERFGLQIVTEAMETDYLDRVADCADIVQIGSRNMQNYPLLRRAGRLRKPVLLKRGMSATLEEFLMAAEYVMAEGNRQVLLCERGVRTFADHSRNTLDLSVVPAVKRISHLPIIVDPSHGTGVREQVAPMARAAVAAGADGLLVEVHHQPMTALSDGGQSLSPAEFEHLMTGIRAVASAVGRTVA